MDMGIALGIGIYLTQYITSEDLRRYGYIDGQESISG